MPKDFKIYTAEFLLHDFLIELTNEVVVEFKSPV